MTGIKVGQNAWVRTLGTARHTRVEVLELPSDDRRSAPNSYIVRHPNGVLDTVHQDRMVATLDELITNDFTEDDEPQGEVPDLPPFSPSQRLAEAVKLANAAAAASLHAVGPVSEHRMGEAIHELPPPVPAMATANSTPPVSARWTGERIDAMIAHGIPKKQFAPGGYSPHISADGKIALPGRIDISTLTQQRTEHVKQNPDAPTVMGLPGDRHPTGKVDYPQKQRRDALAHAYGILHDDDHIVDVTDAIRLAEYIINGTDYADTPRSIRAEALRTETDAATDLAVRKLLDTPRTEDGKRWD